VTSAAVAAVANTARPIDASPIATNPRSDMDFPPSLALELLSGHVLDPADGAVRSRSCVATVWPIQPR
jgi:hypothetical protein